MAMGRPPRGPALVDGLAGDAEDKERLRVILETVAGTRTVEDACALLDVSRTRFFQLRDQALAGALAGLERKKPGRKPKQDAPDKVRELQSQVKELELELHGAYARTELALTMPHLFKEKGAAKKGGTAGGKKASKKAKRKKPPRS